MLATSRHSPWTHSTFWTSLWAPIVTAGTHRFPKATTPLFLAKTAVSRLKTARLSGRNATPVLVLQYLTTSRTALCYDCWSDLRSKDIPVHENESLVNSQLRFEHKQHWCRSCWSHHNVLDLMPERTVPRVSTCRITHNTPAWNMVSCSSTCLLLRAAVKWAWFLIHLEFMVLCS